ncbi:MAG: hypothetical protein PVG39_11355 [Desulfobacteraceae bacterium]|jgi:hypothetical protein
MAQDVRRRKQATVLYSTNNEKQEPLGRGMVYREIYLRLRGAPTLTGANNTQAKTLVGDEWAVVKKVEIIANNTEVIWSVSGNQLWWLNRFFFLCPPPVTAAMGDGATANVAFDSTLVLPFWMPRSVRPMDTALDARRLSDLKIRIQWGTYTDINASASAWTTEPYIDVHSLECSNVKGRFATQKLYTEEHVLAAANTQYQVKLPVGEMYRGFLINAQSDAADVTTILNNFKIRSGTTIFADIPSVMLTQVDGWTRIGCNQSFDGAAAASAAYDKLRRGTPNVNNGWYFYDHVTDGRLTEAIDTLGFSEFILELDVSKPGTTDKLFIIPWTVIPVRGKQ